MKTTQVLLNGLASAAISSSQLSRASTIDDKASSISSFPQASSSVTPGKVFNEASVMPTSACPRAVMPAMSTEDISNNLTMANSPPSSSFDAYRDCRLYCESERPYFEKAHPSENANDLVEVCIDSCIAVIIYGPHVFDDAIPMIAVNDMKNVSSHWPDDTSKYPIDVLIECLNGCEENQDVLKCRFECFRDHAKSMDEGQVLLISSGPTSHSDSTVLNNRYALNLIDRHDTDAIENCIFNCDLQNEDVDILAARECVKVCARDNGYEIQRQNEILGCAIQYARTRTPPQYRQMIRICLSKSASQIFRRSPGPVQNIITLPASASASASVYSIGSVDLVSLSTRTMISEQTLVYLVSTVAAQPSAMATTTIIAQAPTVTTRYALPWLVDATQYKAATRHTTATPTTHHTMIPITTQYADAVWTETPYETPQCKLGGSKASLAVSLSAGSFHVGLAALFVAVLVM